MEMLQKLGTQILQMNADGRGQELDTGKGNHRSLTAADGVGPAVMQVSYCDVVESIYVICAICVQLLSLVSCLCSSASSDVKMRFNKYQTVPDAAKDRS